MPEDVYEFDSKPWMDGSIPVLKNGSPTVCPDASIIALPGVLEGQVAIVQPPCRKSCPRLHQVTRAKREDPENKESGYIMACERTPQFIKIGEAPARTETKLKLKN